MLVAVATGQTSAGQQGTVDFNLDVRPILSDKCFKCHGPDKEKRKAELRLDKRSGAVRDLGGYAAIHPGDPEESEMYYRVRSEDEDLRMPPDADAALTQAQSETLGKWISEGAEYRAHWAYVSPQKAAMQEVAGKRWGYNEIDRFVLDRLETEGLKPSAPAEDAILIRRLYFDLIGLPPSVDQVQAFASDTSDDAYESLVDTLLESPRFGEKWAQHWLDLARYADSNGYHHDDLRSIWPYRDWVIRAMNEDMPFDRFTIEQLAGDLLPNATRDQRIATGFHRNTSANLAGGSKIDEVRASLLFDRVSTTGTVWLGSTFECAQCHNHKFDPFSQADYYGLFAFFNNDVAEIERDVTGKHLFRGSKIELPISTDRRAKYEALGVEQDELQNRLDGESEIGLKGIGEWEANVDRTALPDNIMAILRSSTPEARNDIARQQLEAHFLDQIAEIKELKASLETVSSEYDQVKPDTSLVMEAFEEGRETHRYLRGNFLTPGEVVEASTPQVLHAFNKDFPTDRLGLARWLVSPDNPLVGRVTVNRWWAEIFGHGIVLTNEDFGSQGDAPSHPALLDWLAVELVENDWSMKALLKQMVMSATYRQSSDVDSELLESDPKNQLYARGPRFRLPAEAIRDNALAISGLLAKELGGPPAHPPQPDNLWNEIHGIVDAEYPLSTGTDRFRRGLYTIVRRGAPYPSFITFDAPNRASCSTRRIITNSPLQALNLMNDPVYVEAAQALANRIEADLPDASIEERVRYAFRMCVAREPRVEEMKVLLDLYGKKAREHSEDSGRNSDFGPWFYVSNTLLNLDETITKR